MRITAVSFLVISVAALAGCATPRGNEGFLKPELRAEPPALREADGAPVQPAPRPEVVAGDPTGHDPESVTAEPGLDRDTILAIQVALDRRNLSPGCVDGQLGGHTVQAVRAWQEREGLPATGEADEALMRLASSIADPIAGYVVSDADHKSLGTVPAGWKAKADVEELPYETILETVAEKHHATEQLILDLNPGVAWPNPPAGTALKVPLVLRPRWQAAARLSISFGGKHVRAYDTNGVLIAHFPCSIGSTAATRPVGETLVKNAADNPTFTYDPAVFIELPPEERGTKKLVIPPGPNNPVGIAWVGLALPGYGIHGTPKPEDIGQTESHGCFRLANWNAKKLIDMVSIGIPVAIEE